MGAEELHGLWLLHWFKAISTGISSRLCSEYLSINNEKIVYYFKNYCIDSFIVLYPSEEDAIIIED